MKYIGIFPAERTIRTIETTSFGGAKRLVFGKAGVDHGVLARGLGYVVYEFGLYEPPGSIGYFALPPRIIAGATLLYAFDEAGDGIDVDSSLADSLARVVIWTPTTADVEALIARDVVQRPTVKMNGELIWSWPEPRPAMMGARRR